MPDVHVQSFATPDAPVHAAMFWLPALVQYVSAPVLGRHEPAQPHASAEPVPVRHAAWFWLAEQYVDTALVGAHEPPQLQPSVRPVPPVHALWLDWPVQKAPTAVDTVHVCPVGHEQPSAVPEAFVQLLWFVDVSQ
jgi:hypothetical protein